MSNIDKRALREAAEKATALNLDTAQEARQENDECIECPTCGGDGYMEVQRDYCNIDGVALGVLFYGIGEHHVLAERFFRAANPATVLALLDELEAKDKRIAELEAREVVLPQRYSMLHRVDFNEPYHTEMVYKQHQVLEALHDAGVNVAAAGKGE